MVKFNVRETKFGTYDIAVNTKITTQLEEKFLDNLFSEFFIQGYKESDYCFYIDREYVSKVKDKQAIIDYLISIGWQLDDSLEFKVSKEVYYYLNIEEYAEDDCDEGYWEFYAIKKDIYDEKGCLLIGFNHRLEDYLYSHSMVGSDSAFEHELELDNTSYAEVFFNKIVKENEYIYIENKEDLFE